MELAGSNLVGLVQGGVLDKDRSLEGGGFVVASHADLLDVTILAEVLLQLQLQGRGLFTESFLLSAAEKKADIHESVNRNINKTQRV